MLACQEIVTLRKNQDLVGTVQEILVDGVNDHKIDPNPDRPLGSAPTGLQWKGRTSTNKIVHFAGGLKHSCDNQRLTGQILRIMIEEALPHCLLGRKLSSQAPV